MNRLMDEKVNSLMGFLINLIQNVGTCSVFPCAHPRWIMMDPRIHSFDQLRSASWFQAFFCLSSVSFVSKAGSSWSILSKDEARQNEAKRGETRRNEIHRNEGPGLGGKNCWSRWSWGWGNLGVKRVIKGVIIKMSEKAFMTLGYLGLKPWKMGELYSVRSCWSFRCEETDSLWKFCHEFQSVLQRFEFGPGLLWISASFSCFCCFAFDTKKNIRDPKCHLKQPWSICDSVMARLKPSSGCSTWSARHGRFQVQLNCLFLFLTIFDVFDVAGVAWEIVSVFTWRPAPRCKLRQSVLLGPLWLYEKLSHEKPMKS